MRLFGGVVRRGLCVAVGCLVGGGAAAAALTVGSAENRIASGNWSAQGVSVTAADTVTIYAAAGAELTFDEAFSPASVEINCPGTLSVTSPTVGAFSPGAVDLTNNSRLTVRGAGGSLGTVTGLGTGTSAAVLLVESGAWAAETLVAGVNTGGNHTFDWTVAAGASLDLSAQLCTANMQITVAGELNARAGVITATRGYTTSYLTVQSGGVMRVTGDYTVSHYWTAHQLVVTAGGCLEVSGTLTVDGTKTDSGTVLTIAGTLRAGALLEKMSSGIAVDVRGGVLVLSGPFSCAKPMTWQGTSVQAWRGDVEISGAEVTLAEGAASALSAGPERKITFAPSQCSGAGALTLAGNLGTVDVGIYRPTLAGRIRGTLQFTPGADDREVSFACTKTARMGIDTRLVSSLTGLSSGILLDGWLDVSGGAPVLTLSGAQTWKTGAWENIDAGIPRSGVVAVQVQGAATLTVEEPVALTTLSIAGREDGASLQVAEGSLSARQTMVVNCEVTAQVGTYGAVTLMNGGALLFTQDGQFTSLGTGGTVGLSVPSGEALTLGNITTTKAESTATRLLLRSGTFRKAGAGDVTLQAYNVADAANQSIEVTGGTLTFFEQGGLGTNTTMKRDRHIFKSLSVARGCTFTEYAKWGVHFAVSESLRGEGTIRTQTGSQSGLRKFFISGDAADFTGALDFVWTSLVFEEGSSGQFGGSVRLESGNRTDVKVVVERAAGVSVAGDVTLGAGVGLDLSAGGALTVGGRFALGGTTPVALPADASAGMVLVELTRGVASDEVAALFSVTGFRVEAVGNLYRLAAD